MRRFGSGDSWLEGGLWERGVHCELEHTEPTALELVRDGAKWFAD